MLKTRITDGRGSNYGAQVTERGHALLTTSIPSDPRDIPFATLNIEHWENGFFTDNAASPSQDLTINGATTPTEFGVLASQDRHIFIERVAFTFHSSGMKLDSNEIRNFGAVGAALSNGLDFTFRSAGEEFNLFGDNVTVFSQFYRYMDEVFGVTDGVSAGVDFVVMHKHFPRPLAIEARSDDKLTVLVQDNLTSIALFEVEFEGYHINSADGS